MYSFGNENPYQSLVPGLLEIAASMALRRWSLDACMLCIFTQQTQCGEPVLQAKYASDVKHALSD